MLRIIFIVILFHLFFTYSISQTEDELSESAINIKINTEILASDSLEGRGTGTKGENLAANYIAQKFNEYGLIPLGSDGSYFQYIPMHASIPLSSSELKIYFEEKETELELNRDYLLYTAGQQTFIPMPRELVFVGYGIIAPEFDYNDYQSVDVEGKIVVFIDGEPESSDKEFFDGEAPSIYSYPGSKQRLAISRGAAGSIFINTSEYIQWQEQMKEFSFEDVSLAYSISNNLSILLNPESASLLFDNADHSFTDVLEMKKSSKLRSFPLNVSVTFKGEYTQRDFISSNVMGMIEGNDDELKDTYLLITAHYDHLGIGTPVDGDSIYNGALDNATGVSVLMELADRFLSNQSRRSIIFLALTGEEKGLLGSTFYTDNPVVPIHKTIANINIDGVPFFPNFEGVVGIGSEYSTLKNFLISTADEQNLIVEKIPPAFQQFEAFNRSDQIAFALAGIPSMLVLEGLQNKNKSEDEVLSAFLDYTINRYHTPFDDLNQDINFNAAARFTEFLYQLIYKIANSDEPPVWNDGSPFINARLRAIAEGR